MIQTHQFGKPLLLVLLGALPGFAQQCVVTNTDDSGTGSLRAAIADTSCTSIVFGPGLVVGDIVLSSGELLINRSLTIAGPGANNVTIRTRLNSRVFHIIGASTVATISGLTIRLGRALEEDAAGGGIYLEAATLNLTDSTVKENHAYKGGGIYASGGTLNVTNSTVAGNLARSYGGGIYHRGEPGQTLTLNLYNSTVVYNRALSETGGGLPAAFFSGVEGLRTWSTAPSPGTSPGTTSAALLRRLLLAPITPR